MVKSSPKVKAGICVDQFSAHDRNVALILNLPISHISYQYHVVFDNQFLTVTYLSKDEYLLNWKPLVLEHAKYADPQLMDLNYV